VLEQGVFSHQLFFLSDQLLIVATFESRQLLERLSGFAFDALTTPSE